LTTVSSKAPLGVLKAEKNISLYILTASHADLFFSAKDRDFDRRTFSSMSCRTEALQLARISHQFSPRLSNYEFSFYTVKL
jgi:hypothetical protein